MTHRLATATFALITLCSCAPSWSASSQTLSSLVLSVDGDGQEGLYLAGGGLGDSQPGFLQRFANGRWTRLDTGGTETLWWVGRGGSARFAVGESGLILRVEGTTATRMNAPVTTTLFGVWGASADDVWAVGGNPLGGVTNDVVLHFDGTTWSAVDVPEKRGVALLKVWGTSSSDVWMCGQQGTLWRWNGAAFEAHHLATRGNVTTVAGRSASDVWAVGGPPLAFFHDDGAEWSSVEGPALTSALAGVAFGKNGAGVAVGSTGTRWHLASGKQSWTDASDDDLSADLHGAYVFDDGRAVAVGGNYLALSSPSATRKGALLTYGFTLPAP
jgi:hypothetical protein